MKKKTMKYFLYEMQNVQTRWFLIERSPSMSQSTNFTVHMQQQTKKSERLASSEKNIK